MSRRSFLLLGMTAVGGASATLRVFAGSLPVAAKLGSPAPPFQAPDTRGHQRALSEFKGKTLVLEWTSSTCPFAAAQYKSGRMQELQRWAMAKNVVWLTVLSSHPSRSEYLPPVQAEAFNRQRGGAP